MENPELKMILLNEEEIVERSMIIVLLEGKKSVPFLVYKKVKGKTLGTASILGETVERVILQPSVYPFREPALSRLHMLGGLNRINIGVRGFRRPSEEERKICLDKVRQIKQFSESMQLEIIAFIEKQY